MFAEAKSNSLTSLNHWKLLDETHMTNLAVSASTAGLYGVYFDMTEKDGRYLLMVKNTAESGNANVTVKAGNAAWAVEGLEPTITLAPGRSAIIQIESGRFKFVTPVAAMDAHGSSSVSSQNKVYITADTANVYACVFKTVI